MYDSLPVTVVVQVHHFRRLPLPDDRLVDRDTSQFQQAFMTDPWQRTHSTQIFNRCTVIDRDGSFLYRSESGGSVESGGVDDLLRWLFTSGRLVSGPGSVGTVGTARPAKAED